MRKEEGGAKPRNEFCMVRPPGACFCIVVLGHGSLLVAVYYIFAYGGLRNIVHKLNYTTAAKSELQNCSPRNKIQPPEIREGWTK